MEKFEEEVFYFTSLVTANIQTAKDKKGEKFQTVFNCLKMSEDGQSVDIYRKNDERLWYLNDIFNPGSEKEEYAYELEKKEIENYQPINSETWELTKVLALRYIDKLDKYNRKKITFEELAEIKEPVPEVVKNLLKQKNNISEQLKLLYCNRNIPEVQKYIEDMYKEKYLSPYMKYMIDKYYYHKKDLVRPEKNGLDNWGKILLRWD